MELNGWKDFLARKDLSFETKLDTVLFRCSSLHNDKFVEIGDRLLNLSDFLSQWDKSLHRKKIDNLQKLVELRRTHRRLGHL